MRQAPDWSRDQIVTALHNAGYSLADIDRQLGRVNGSCNVALQHDRAMPVVKTAIAAAIGVPPQRIWPSLFNDEGLPRRNRIGGPRVGSTKASRAALQPHVQKPAAE